MVQENNFIFYTEFNHRKYFIVHLGKENYNILKFGEKLTFGLHNPLGHNFKY